MSNNYILDDDVSLLNTYGEYSDILESLNKQEEVSNNEAVRGIVSLFNRGKPDEKIEMAGKMVDAIPEENYEKAIDIFKNKLKTEKLSEEAKEEFSKNGIDVKNLITYGEAIQKTIDDIEEGSSTKTILTVLASIVSVVYPYAGTVMTAILPLISKDKFLKICLSTSFPTTATTRAIKKEKETDEEYDDDCVELSECGNYELIEEKKIDENILTEAGNELIKNMSIMQALGTGGRYRDSGTDKGWLRNFILKKLNGRSGGEWTTAEVIEDKYGNQRKVVYFTDSKGNKYPTTLTRAIEDGQDLSDATANYVSAINQKDKDTIISAIGRVLAGYALGVKRKFEKDERFSGWDQGSNRGYSNRAAVKFQGFIEEKLKRYLEKHIDELRDFAISRFSSGSGRSSGKMGVYGNNNMDSYTTNTLSPIVERVCKQAFKSGRAYGEQINDGFLKCIVSGYIKKDKLSVLDGSTMKYFRNMEEHDDFCYNQKDDTKILATIFYSFTKQEDIDRSKADNFQRFWNSIITNSTKYDSSLPVPVPMSLMSQSQDNPYKDYRHSAEGEKIEAEIGVAPFRGWVGFSQALIGTQVKSGQGFRNATSGKSPRDARNPVVSPEKADLQVNQQIIEIPAEDDSDIDNADIDFKIYYSEATPQYKHGGGK